MGIAWGEFLLVDVSVSTAKPNLTPGQTSFSILKHLSSNYLEI